MPFHPSTPLLVKRVDHEDWELTGDLRYDADDPTPMFVRTGFVTNFASVPRPFRWLIPVSGRYTTPTVLHDHHCRVECRNGTMTWKDADGLLRRSMGEEGVPTLQRYVIWGSVRIGHIFRDATARDVVGIVLIALAVFITATAPILAAFWLLNLLWDTGALGARLAVVLTGVLWVSAAVWTILATMSAAEYLWAWIKAAKDRFPFLPNEGPLKSKPAPWW